MIPVLAASRVLVSLHIGLISESASHHIDCSCFVVRLFVQIMRSTLQDRANTEKEANPGRGLTHKSRLIDVYYFQIPRLR